MLGKISAGCLGLTCLIMLWPAVAEAGNGTGLFGNGIRTYAAVSYGWTKLGRERLGAVSNASLDDQDNGYRISAGVEGNNGIMLGFAYNDFGTAEFSAESGGRYILDGVEQTAATGLKLETPVTSYGPYIAFDIPLTVLVERGQPAPPVSVVPKIGLHFWEVESDMRGGGASLSLSDDGSDVYYGADLTYKYSNRLSLMAGYDRYRISGDTIDYLYLGSRISLY
ncbi:MAG: outer membrane beta-barrel protein [Parvularculales bacterium]